MEHELKSWPEFFKPLLEGTKNFEIRKNDRNFNVGDVLVLREFSPCKQCNGSGRAQWDAWDSGACNCKAPHGRYTGRRVRAKVVYITDFHQPEDQVVMSIKVSK